MRRPGAQRNPAEAAAIEAIARGELAEGHFTAETFEAAYACRRRLYWLARRRRVRIAAVIEHDENMFTVIFARKEDQ